MLEVQNEWGSENRCEDPCPGGAHGLGVEFTGALHSAVSIVLCGAFAHLSGSGRHAEEPSHRTFVLKGFVVADDLFVCVACSQVAVSATYRAVGTPARQRRKLLIKSRGAPGILGNHRLTGAI